MSPISDLKSITDKILRECIETANKFFDIMESLNEKVTLDKFGSILFNFYQAIMHDILPSSLLLANKMHLISFSILCRPFFETIIQIKWILSLPENKKEEAIKLFLNFEGVEFNSKGQPKYEWYDLMEISSKFSFRKMAIDLKLDVEQIPFDVSKIDLSEENRNMSIYDFLSKTSHLNPKFLKDFIGLDKTKNVTFKPFYYTQSILICMTFVNCIAVFFDIFLNHYYKDLYEEKNKELKDVQKNFENFIQSYNDPHILDQ